jgi:Mn2+/Fe2+ NRAMP family transporter
MANPEPSSKRSPVVGPSKPRLLGLLGPGLITGASDDDPSGIGTYSQAGAQFGFAISWTMLFSYPLMAAIQEISGRIGRTTGRGIAGNLRKYYPNWLLQSVVLLLCIANTINIGADLGAMGDATGLLVGGPQLVYVVSYGIFCCGLQIAMRYTRYVSILKWLTVSLFAYFGTVMVVDVPWSELGRGLFIPSLSSDVNFWTTVVAILGTTISPYLFFWQASQEVEDIKAISEREPLVKKPRQGPDALERIRLDTYVGMALSNLVGLAIVVTTAATLHAAGITDIDTSGQAAEALRPIAGKFAFAVFALGIVGTGLLSVPVLAGSAAYGLGEARGWPIGLAREPKDAIAFYATIALATLIGSLINFLPIDPIKALFWSAVINGVVAVPIMAIMMIIATNPAIMGKFRISTPLQVVGWLATVVMAAATTGMLVGQFF